MKATTFFASAALGVLLAVGSAQAQSVTPAASGGSGGDCDQGVQSTLMSAKVDSIAQQQALATNNFPMMTQNFGQLSCLDNIMNSGADIFFNVPSLEQLMNMLSQAVCNAAQGLMSQATAPLYQKLNQANGGMQGALGGGEIIPGVNMGGLAGGINLRPTSGGAGVTTNLSSVLSGNGTSGGSQTVFGSGGSTMVNSNPVGGSSASGMLGGLFGSNGGSGGSGGVGQNIQWNNPTSGP